jgi:uncharacterized protein (TIGR03435 family)
MIASIMIILTLSLAGSSQRATTGAAPEPEFDVASIKPVSMLQNHRTADAAFALGMGREARHGHFHVRNATLHRLIQLAYDLRDSQIIGEPRWAKSELYEVEAKTADDISFEQMRPMLRSLLAERFNLKVHQSVEELPVYELAPARAGIKITQAKEGSCVKFDPDGAPVPPGTKLCGGIRYMFMKPGVVTMQGFGANVAMLIDDLSEELGSVIVDKTGFSGTFNFQLDYFSEEYAAPNAPSRTTSAESDGAGAQTNTNPPPLFIALQEQLGMKLAPSKGMVKVLIVDTVQRPTPN